MDQSTRGSALKARRFSDWHNFVFTIFITVSQSSVKGKTIIQVNVDAKNILAEFTFDTERFSMDDFDECK